MQFEDESEEEELQSAVGRDCRLGGAIWVVLKQVED